MEPEQRDPAPRVMRVIANRKAGAVLQQGEAHFEQALEEAFAAQGVRASVVMADPADIAARFAMDVADARYDLVVVAGGDGTVNGILPALRRAGRPVGVLPLGTLNVIGRDLGVGPDLAAAAEALATGRAVDVDLVTVNGAPFHSNAGIGWLVTMAVERDAARRRIPFSRQIAFGAAVLLTLFRSRSLEVELETEHGRAVVRTDAVLVTNNRFTGSPWSRPRLDEGVFELHVVRAPTVLARLRTLIALARGSWRDLDGIETIEATHAVLRRRGRRDGRIAMDGELVRLRYPFEFRMAPKAVRLIAAPSAAAGETS